MEMKFSQSECGEYVGGEGWIHMEDEGREFSLWIKLFFSRLDLAGALGSLLLKAYDGV